MKLSVTCSSAEGKIKSIASKSVAHRLLICAAFADAPTKILCEETNKDIEATAACLNGLGAKITRIAPYYEVIPTSRENVIKNAILPCGESGSTLRFLLPVVSALGAECSFVTEGRLSERPLSPLKEELEAHGITINGSDIISVSGTLTGSSYVIDGNVSSQFISGLLFALTLLPREATLEVRGKIESAPYVDMTEDALSIFGAAPEKEGRIYKIGAKGRLSSPGTLQVEGDWSNAAFPLALGVMKGEVKVSGLNPNSRQGDMAIVEILRRFGGKIEYDESDGTYTAYGSELCGTDIDASQIPDLVPILATVASVATGKTVIRGAARLRFKESDRIMSVRQTLSALGADVEETADGLIINGKKELIGGEVSSFNDHRIAMSAAVACSVCKEPVIISGAEAVAKSYPSFWQDISLVGIASRQI